MLRDTVEYLPGDLLVKVDRAAMSVGLETRLPFLSPEVFGAAWRMDLARRAGRGQGKSAVKRVLGRFLPSELVDRPKMGFGVPVSHWLRGDLRPWAESLLDANRLRSEGYLDAALIRDAWSEHLSGRRDHGHRIWAVCTFQAWMEHWGN